MRLVSGALSADGAPAVPFVHDVASPDVRLELEEFHHAYVIGRSPRCDLPLQDDDCSRRHVELERSGSDVVVRDLGSKNGSHLDGKRVEGEQRWAPGQVLLVGATRLQLSDPLREVLDEIESSQDEIVSEADVSPPDESDDSGTVNDRGAAAAQEIRGTGAATGGIAERPTGDAALASPRGSRASWGTVDVLVAVFALAVLGVSVAGLLWLMRS